MSLLKFEPFASFLEPGFWYKLTQHKLDVCGLDDSPISIKGYYSNGAIPGLPAKMNVDYAALDQLAQPPVRTFPTHGILYNKNTMEEFRQCDKKALIDGMGKELLDDITSNRCVENPELLSKFLLLTYADLKKYHYYYWFAFPALCLPESTNQKNPPATLDTIFSGAQLEEFQVLYDGYTHIGGKAYLCLLVDADNKLSLHPLRDFLKISQLPGKVFFVFADPSTLEAHPGWPLRNLLALITHHWCGTTRDVEVIALRDSIKAGVRSIAHSLVISAQISASKTEDTPACVGWEKNERQNMGPRMVNLSASMDPTRLAESAVDLNLKLMRWRLVPELDLDVISNNRCLLLGAGTLGCNVARLLLGWGVRTITFVDNSMVSYSNPVRQTLYTFQHCVGGSTTKAEAAARSLEEIFPKVKAKGVSLSIPMPGHCVAESAVAQTMEDVVTLEELINTHDTVFLLMDTRESRWLPTLIAAAKHKLVINAALGFDTFLVLRHGVKDDGKEAGDHPIPTTSSTVTIPGSLLGCYFCNDVVAPGNSTRDRTLDQQCTVTRPGVSMMAAALAVELLVTVLQHPDRGRAPSSCSSQTELSSDLNSPLGILPHQIRGFLSRLHFVLPACMAFDKCTACSSVVVDKYREDGFEFLLNAFNNPTYLEDLTGLTELHQESAAAEVWELSDDEDTHVVGAD